MSVFHENTQTHNNMKNNFYVIDCTNRLNAVTFCHLVDVTAVTPTYVMRIPL